MNHTFRSSSIIPLALTLLTSSLSLAQTAPATTIQVAAADSAGAADPATLATLGVAGSEGEQPSPPETEPAPSSTANVGVATDTSTNTATSADVAAPVANTTTTPADDAPIEAATPVPEPVAVHDHVAIGGGAIVYLYQPLREGRGNVGVFFANLLLDAKWGAFGLHLEPRFRDTKLRPFFDGPAWLQEAYASASFAPFTIKAGKVYKRSGGLFWDNSFFGNVQVYDGLKLDPNYGISVEGSVGDELGLDFALQYFVVDGLTNVSLQGRDTISIPGARRRHTKAAKLEPWLKFGEGGELRLGGSIEHFVADIPDAHDRVLRGGADLKVTYDLGEAGSVGAWGEFVHQSGRHVIDHPAAGTASNNTNYVLAGGQYSFWKLTARYNFSNANYKSVDIKETLHVPGLGVAVNEQITVLGELAHWRQYTPAGTIKYNDSLNVTLSGRF